MISPPEDTIRRKSNHLVERIPLVRTTGLHTHPLLTAGLPKDLDQKGIPRHRGQIDLEPHRLDGAE